MLLYTNEAAIQGHRLDFVDKACARLGFESAGGYCSHIKALRCSAFHEKKRYASSTLL